VRQHRRGIGPIVLAAILVVSARPAHSDPASGAWSYDIFFNQFRGMRPDSTRVARVSGLFFERDVATFVLEEGTLALCTPVGGEMCAAVFTGRGSFAFAPASEVEREQLKRLYGSTLVRRGFSALVLVFADSTRQEFESALTFAPGKVPLESKKVLERCLDDLSHDATGYVHGTLARTLLGHRRDGHLFAGMLCEGGPLYLEIDPYSFEEVILMRRHPGPRQLGIDFASESREVISSLRLGGQSSDSLEGDQRPEFAIRRVMADLRLREQLDVVATAQLEGEVQVDELAFLPLQLYSKLSVDSARVNGRPAVFARRKDNWQLWLQLEPPARRGDTLRVEVRYHGPLLERTRDWFWLPVVDTWLPHHGGLHRRTFDLTFHHPKKFRLASISDLVSMETRGDITTSRWVCTRPVQYAAFNLGFMKERDVEVAGLPRITVQMSSEHHDEWARELSSEGVASGRNMDKQVGADVANSLSFFQKVYGPLPVKRFFATETPVAHGISFPGMIALYTGTFQVADHYGHSELFRAHEVAHQWWPYGVGPRSYHDVWLSEGFAQFSALWFLQASSQRPQRYFDLLETWRREILEGAKGKPGSGLQVGPTWLGNRNSVGGRTNAYHLAVYQKGAWILHMLRNLLIDLDSMNEDRFLALMKGFQETYQGREASTQDFRLIAEQYAGEDLGWFFRQWVYGADIPTYRFAWKAVPDASGQFVVHCRIEQRGVPESFRMKVPLLIDLGEKGHARLRLDVHGAVSEIELPPVAAMPKQVVFNDLLSVLCQVENVAWK